MEDETFLSRHSSSRNSKLILYVCLTCFCDPQLTYFSLSPAPHGAVAVDSSDKVSCLILAVASSLSLQHLSPHSITSPKTTARTLLLP